MINIVIVSHASIAGGFISGVELIMGKVPGLSAIGLMHADSFEAFSRNINRELERAYCEDGVLILVDLFGGTPSNASAISIKNCLESGGCNIECVSGVNLPMVVEAISMRDGMNLKDLRDYCMDAGRSGIKDIREEFGL